MTSFYRCIRFCISAINISSGALLISVFPCPIPDIFVTSKIYLRYAVQYLVPELIDEVDEKAILETMPA
jgi:hypothetical protein